MERSTLSAQCAQSISPRGLATNAALVGAPCPPLLCSLCLRLCLPSAAQTGRRLLTGTQMGEFCLLNGVNFHFDLLYQAHETAIRSMAWSKDGRWLTSGDDSGCIRSVAPLPPGPALVARPVWKGFGLTLVSRKLLQPEQQSSPVDAGTAES